MSQHNLVHHGDWYSCQLDVLDTAFVLDFVFSDTAKRSWDNNAQQVITPAAAALFVNSLIRNVPRQTAIGEDVMPVMHSIAVAFRSPCSVEGARLF